MVGRLAPTLAFTTLSLFNILRFPLVVLPKAMRALSEALASIARVEDFLLEDVPTDLEGIKKSNSNGVSIVSSAAVLMRFWVCMCSDSRQAYCRAHQMMVLTHIATFSKAVLVLCLICQQCATPHVFSHPQSDFPAFCCCLQRNAKFKHYGKEDFALNVPEFSCKPGELVAVVGRVGAGKSSLIHAVLGNMQPVQGTAEAGGRVSYVPQNPWCQNLSLRDNITFGLPFDEEKYGRVSCYAACRDI
jgi:ABC-type multidrug transport system fused ATPase/permease subunit